MGEIQLVTHRAKSQQASLPTDRAFVVQFTTTTDMHQRRVAGRVEHVASGHSSHFRSLQELWAFIAQMLGEKQGKEDPS